MKYHKRLFYTALSFALTLGTSISAVQAAELTLSDVPLFIKDGVDPNMIVTLDDSGSMAWSYVPDGISGTRHSRRFKAASFNPMYFDPSINYIAPKKADGTSYSTSFTQAWKNGFIPDISGNGSIGSSDYVNLSNNYRPQYKYYPTSRDSLTSGSSGLANNPEQEFGDSDDSDIIEKDHESKGVAAYYYVFDASNDDCNGSADDDDCYDYVAVSSTQQQNFANWYSFYRTRVLATASASSLAFQTVGSDVRVAWQNLWKCNGFDTDCRDFRNSSSHEYDSRIRPFSGSHRDDFYDWLQYAPASGGTPLRSAVIRAGDLIKNTSINSPYAKNPGVTKDPMYECRPTYHIAMTDGLWNSDTITSYGNYDSADNTTPGGCTGTDCPAYEQKYGEKTYTASAPFEDESSNSVADIVFSQWINDAQPNIPNRVPTYIIESDDDKDVEYWNPKNDPAEWQHMTTFTVGFGLSRSLTDPNYDDNTYGGDYPSLLDGTKDWPNVGSNSSNNPYDLWHAAINGRGEFFSVDDPNSLVDAFASIIAGIQDRDTSAASIALDSGIVNGLSYAYHAKFYSQNWTGDLQAFELLAPDYVAATTSTWSASEKLENRYSNRVIKMADATGTLTNFSYANMTPAQQALMNLDISNNADSLGSDRVEYLRGDASKEGNPFRSRGGLRLGDIVHSSPTYVGAPNRIGYDTLENKLVTDTDSYTKFKQDQASREALVYVGANDGMFHAFNASSGEEHFAFVPTAVIPNLRQLTYPGYSHQFYVDGSTSTGDVYDQTSNKWRTIVVGTLRQGGKSLFALDVTDPDNIELLWEFTDTDLGYTYSKPSIVRLHNNKWGVLVGNGYNSTNHKAVMYALDAITGTVMKKFDTGVGTFAVPNGLAVPSPVDINGDLVVDYVYSGDLHGNVWRFDLIDTSLASPIHASTGNEPRNNAIASKWSIGYGGTPLFTAKDGETPANTQPITTNVVASPHESGTGIIVMFGTGKYLEASDAQADTAHAQSYYGIWDRYVLGEITSSSTLSTITRSDLQEQELSVEATDDYIRKEIVNGVETDVAVSNTTREISQHSVDWYDYTGTTPTLNKQGWYIDFVEGSTDKGEMLVTDSLVLGNVVIFASTVPNTDPCQAGVDRWVWALDIQTGGRTNNPIFDLNNDKVVDNLDKDPGGEVNNSVKTAGFGAVAAVGESLYLNMDSTIESIKTDPQGSNLRRSWRVVK